MAVRMRLRREGKKKNPFYRVVVADSRSPRDGRYIEDIGYYQPLHDPSTIEIDAERALYWLRNGVQPSDQVKQLLRVSGIWETFKPGDTGRDRTAKIEARRRAAEERDARIAEAEAAAAKEIAAQQAQAEAEAAEEAVEEAAEEAVEAADEQSVEDTEAAAEAPADAEASAQDSAAEVSAQDNAAEAADADAEAADAEAADTGDDDA